MAPGLVGPEKAARGKLPTDTWWHTIVSPTGQARSSAIPRRSRSAILARIVLRLLAARRLVLDFFAGSGTTGDAARREGRRFLLVDENPEAIARDEAALRGV